MIDSPTNGEAFRYYPRLRRVLQHLSSRIAEPLSAAEAARIADLSPNYFSTYFRQRVGVSFTRWAHRVRIAAAVGLLRQSELGIAEVAGRVGYRDLRTFERAFKRETGVSARRFRTVARPAAGRRSGVLPQSPTGKRADEIAR